MPRSVTSHPGLDTPASSEPLLADHQTQLYDRFPDVPSFPRNPTNS